MLAPLKFFVALVLIVAVNAIPVKHDHGDIDQRLHSITGKSFEPCERCSMDNSNTVSDPPKCNGNCALANSGYTADESCAMAPVGVRRPYVARTTRAHPAPAQLATTHDRSHAVPPSFGQKTADTCKTCPLGHSGPYFSTEEKSAMMEKGADCKLPRNKNWECCGNWMKRDNGKYKCMAAGSPAKVVGCYGLSK